MILRLVLSNVSNDNTLGQRSEVYCSHSCPRVEVECDLARIISAWLRLSNKQKRALLDATS